MRFKENLISYFAVISNEARRTLRLWPQTILPPAITTTLYFLIFGHLMGQRIGHMSGLPYIDFIVPGLIMMTMLMAAYEASTFVLFMAKFNRSIEELLVSPTADITILFSFMSVGILRGMIVGIIVAIIAKLFTGFHMVMPFFAWGVAILACAIFSAFGMLNALYAQTFDQVSIVPTFVITPLSYLGGIFYSINVLPPFWKSVALFNPIVYIINSFRYGFYGISDTSTGIAVSIMAIFFIIIFIIDLVLLRKRIGFS
jgi:ABC-2 type transport system permease protein